MGIRSSIIKSPPDERHDIVGRHGVAKDDAGFDFDYLWDACVRSGSRAKPIKDLRLCGITRGWLRGRIFVYNTLRLPSFAVKPGLFGQWAEDPRRVSPGLKAVVLNQLLELHSRFPVSVD